MNIVYASDNNFAEIMGISIVSLLDNNQHEETINIYVLDSGISKENKKKINEVMQIYKRDTLYWIKAENINEKAGMEVLLDRGSISQFARLFVASSLKGLERVLYLDCDIIINGSLSELWSMDMEGKTIAALLDAFAPLYRKNLGLSEDDIMFNSGVMLIDLEKWKENRIEEKLLSFITRYNGMVPQGDQGALNAVLSRETKVFHPKYNSVTIFYDFKYDDMLVYRKPPFYYEKQEVEEAVGNPTIIHFTTSFLSKRAWIRESKHPHAGLFMDYKKMSPWEQEPLREHKVPRWKKLYVKLYRVLPKALSVRLSGFFQAYARPIKEKLKYNIRY